MIGWLEVGIDKEKSDEEARKIKEEILDLQVPGVQITSVSYYPVFVDLEAETLDHLYQAAKRVERIIGVWQAPLYLGKEALASLLQQGVGE